ncbi:MAG: hypothetical protein V7745_05320 [Pseudomonadales bacterium]
MKSKMLLTTIGAACLSVLLVGCYGDKEEASSPSSATSETEMSGSMMDDVKESAGSVVDSVEDMAGDAVSGAKDAAGAAVDSVKDMTVDAVESGQAAVDDAVKGVQDKMSGSDADMDAESEIDKMKDDLGAQMNKLP